MYGVNDQDVTAGTSETGPKVTGAGGIQPRASSATGAGAIRIHSRTERTRFEHSNSIQRHLRQRYDFDSCGDQSIAHRLSQSE